jgi:hypothetical protein
MIEGLWSVEFESNLGIPGAGIIVFDTQRALGGDSRYFYKGKYAVKGNRIKAMVRVTHFADEPYSIFGELAEFDLCIQGEISEPTFCGYGFRPDDPEKRISLRFTKRAVLP